MTWEWVKYCSAGRERGQLLAKRSDGAYVFVNGANNAATRAKLETFLDKPQPKPCGGEDVITEEAPYANF